MKQTKKTSLDKPPTALKKKIIQIATKKFAKNGYPKTSMNDIAKSANVSKGSLFYHFHSKEELFFIILSQSIDLEFKKMFDVFERQGIKLFEKRENLFEDLKKYYDLFIAGIRDVERLWLEGRIESENNPKLRKMLIKKDNEVAMMVLEILKNSRRQINILEGYNDKELLEITRGAIAMMRGTFLDKLTGKEPKEIKNTWVRTLYIIYSSKKKN